MPEPTPSAAAVDFKALKTLLDRGAVLNRTEQVALMDAFIANSEALQSWTRALDEERAKVWEEAAKTITSAWQIWVLDGPGTNPDAFRRAAVAALAARAAEVRR